uniref:Uncharacterized protein n=1 Tax=viral metagenome TaxID=1070528 RepID=A0A6C0ESR4_9ZZZZ
MYSNTPFIHEKSNIINITKNLSTNTKNSTPKGEYSLKQNFFDPTKSSPPNEFMIKLSKRMMVYASNKSSDNCESE